MAATLPTSNCGRGIVIVKEVVINATSNRPVCVLCNNLLQKPGGEDGSGFALMIPRVFPRSPHEGRIVPSCHVAGYSEVL